MNEPQIWTLIGVFAAIMLGGMTLMTTLLTRTMSTELSSFKEVFATELTAMNSTFESRFAAMDSKFEARFEAMDAKFEARFEAINYRFDSLEHEITVMRSQLTHLDEDVQALTRRQFGGSLD